MTHEAQPSAEYHEDEPAAPRKLFNIENFTPVDVEQFLIATRYAQIAATEAWSRHKVGKFQGISGDDLGAIEGIFEKELRQLPALDLEKAEAVFAHLVASQQVTPRETAGDIIDSLAERQVEHPERLQQTMELWCRMMVHANNENDHDGVISQAAQESALRAIEEDQLPLSAKQQLFDQMVELGNPYGMDEPS